MDEKNSKRVIPSECKIQNSKLLALFIFCLTLGLGIVWFLNNNSSFTFLSPLGSSRETVIKEKPLEKYTYENLKKRGGIASEIKLERVLKQEANFTAWLFSYQSDGRRITGLAHLPSKEGKLPVVVMMRGYIDPLEYQTGTGTRTAGEYYVSHGYLTLAPDFLGYGESDMPPGGNVWEERFLRLPAAMDLLASLESLAEADPEKVFLWGHSNGGMIALSTLELTGKPYPTVLWAPMSQYFPYDVLYYTYEADDGGKSLRKELAEFEKDYDADEYNYTKHLDWITTPIQLHQGTADPHIPLVWSDNLVKNLKAQGVSVTYYTYHEMDHNMRPNWETVVERDLEFFGGH